MNTPNPLIPQGSLEAHQYKKRSATKIVVSVILSIHGVVLGGLLFLGCEKEPATNQAENSPATNQFSEIDHTTVAPADPFSDLSAVTNSGVNIPHIMPPTNNNNPFGNDFANRDPGLTPGGGDSTFPPNPGFATSNRTTAFPPIPTNNVGSSRPLIADSGSSAAPQVYAVLPGDNFSTIAKKHHITVKAIVQANPNVDPRRLQVGQKLNLPANVTPVAPNVPDVGAAAAAANETIYSVKSGDTLYDIGKRYGVTVKELQRANGIVGSTIHVGQKLIIPMSKKSGTK